MGKVLEFKPRVKETDPELEVKVESEPSPLEVALNELCGQYSEEELNEMFNELDELIEQDDEEAALDLDKES